MAYWDTSCLAKLFLLEADSMELRAHAAHGPTVVTSDISRMELWVTLRRHEAEGTLAQGVALEYLEKFDRYVSVGTIAVIARGAGVESEFESVVEECYGADPQIYLRTLDALHLASLRLSGETEMVTTDRRLRAAAKMFGFTLYPEEPEAPPAPSV